MLYPPPEVRQGDYSPGYEQRVISLLGDHDFKRVLWPWQFQHIETVQPVVLLDKDRQVKGFNGVMPVTVSIDGQHFPAVWSCDFVVAGDCRGQGVGKQVKLALQADFPRLMSLGISDSAVRVLSRMGWKPGARVITMRRLGSQRRWRDAPLLLAQAILTRLFGCSRQVGDGDALVWSQQLPMQADVDDLSVRVTPEYSRTVVRDYAYLSWRYEGHPLARYQYLSLQSENGLQALVVVRESLGHLRIVDYLGPAAGVHEILLQAILKRYQGSRLFTCTTSDKNWLKALWRAGYLPQGRQRFYVYSETDGESEGWFLMAGDSDGELLQAARGAHRS
ncbi:hypothetical protein [Corallincola spongiicola]|uniref:N-acetyltransferase domain-containing protein n=1 Tax=Corallincola spongiicola TaxID=2520508 RepID=A0ABY1WPY6_9GAMM|nr:hypothetical protein [Corallincola spongiicola]TAA46800.1 hypothetical protein EXY25_05975 [Corallincola spongiicola]